jgi:pyruvate kinase
MEKADDNTMQRQTKILCTLGPSCDSIPVLKELIRAGMNAARLNMAHGDLEEHRRRIANVRQAARELNEHIPVLMDIKGPEIRIGTLQAPSYELQRSERFILTTRQLEGDAARVSVSYPGLPRDVRVGSTILIDDGAIELEVEAVSGEDVVCLIRNQAVLKPRKGVNIPGVRVSLPGVTERDIEHIRFGLEHGIDLIAMSFVRKAEDVAAVKRLLERHDGRCSIPVVAKIENEEGLANFPAILAASDGIMVARGDLGVEIPAEDVPIVQKQLIRQCNQAGKPVITATQMLDSMQRQPRPTRAEVSDVANAVWDGTDFLMLSGETAAGLYPVEAVQTMARIAARVEADVREKQAAAL